MCTTTAPTRRQRIRDFIDALFEAHLYPAATRPALDGLVGCLTDEEPAGLPHDEVLVVEPGPYRPHPAGSLRRDHGVIDVWAHLADTGCYLHIPREFAARYMLEMSGDHAALAIQASPQVPGLELSENFAEIPVERLIIDPEVVLILMPGRYHHSDIEIAIL